MVTQIFFRPHQTNKILSLIQAYLIAILSIHLK